MVGGQGGKAVLSMRCDPETYVVAVSGGVDSVVLLDMMAKQGARLIVAHFDHGIREDSAQDAEFVAGLAAKYDLPFETKREELGAGASEELARDRRYAFLRSVARRHSARIATAHHADDVVETIAINMSRGTGWRGLAVLSRADTVRPIIGLHKHELIWYAGEHGLEWHEDSTNAQDIYLRNRLRGQLAHFNSGHKQQLGDLRARQVDLKRQIDQEVAELVGKAPYSRYFFTTIGQVEAVELLRFVFIKEVGFSPTEPQRQRALAAIKVARAGSRHDVGDGARLAFTRTEFVVERM
jgi:tRNA(Ile)-lysidine synthetase-like protein